MSEMAEKKQARYKYDIVADRILEDIASGKWKVGEKLPSEAQLIEEYDVSRVTLREGLKKLSVLGVLRIVQGDGTYVDEIVPSRFMEPLLPLMAYSAENINEIYDARICVESGACRLAAQKCTKEYLNRMEELLRNMSDAVDLNDYESYSMYDRKFHNLILSIADNKILETIDGMFGEIIANYISRVNQDPTVIRKSMCDHWELLWAFQSGKGDYAGAIMSEHLERARNVLIQRAD